MISLIGQVLLTIGLAVVMFVVLPPEIYLLVGVIMAIVAAGLMYAVEGEHLEITLSYLASLVAISIGFGVFWPALPAIAVWGGVKRRRVENQITRAAKDTTSSNSSGPPSP